MQTLFALNLISLISIILIMNTAVWRWVKSV